MLLEMNDIRRFKLGTKKLRYDPYDEEYKYFEFRLLEPHKRGILLGNGRMVSVPFPYAFCWSTVNSTSQLFGMAFIQDIDNITLDTPIWAPPLPHFVGFQPSCHPYSEVGRDEFERDFNGVFSSPFSDAWYETNQEYFRILGGSYRIWATLTHDQVLQKLASKKKTVMDMVGRMMIRGQPFKLDEISPIKGRTNGTR